MKYVLVVVICLALLLSGCGNNEIAKIEVSSESLTEDGKWLTTINGTRARQVGSNLSPQLSWSAVDGAEIYAIYMIDTSAGNWLHWRAQNVHDTSLALGAELEESQYIGPYPPSGTHEYEIIVYALKDVPDSYTGAFNARNPNFEAIEEKLDTSRDRQGNIIGKGSIIGTVTVGETVE